MKDRYAEASPSLQKAVSHQLELILASPDFNATQQQIDLLKFVVNQALAGEGREIKEYRVAVEIFGRGPDFNPQIDPIVSIQIDILRRRLARYYKNSGKNDPIRIDTPKGTYFPVFEKRKLNES